MTKYDNMIDSLDAARVAMNSVDPDASDGTIAMVVADYLLELFPRSRVHCLAIFHDVRPATLRRVEAARRRFPDYRPDDPVGSCPLAYDWSRRNCVGISTRDRDRAWKWIIDAMLAGYAVFRRYGRDSNGLGRGSLEDIRKNARPKP